MYRIENLDDDEVFTRKKKLKNKKESKYDFINLNFWMKVSLYLHKSYVKGFIYTCRSIKIKKI